MTTATVQSLLKLPDDQFRAVVEREVDSTSGGRHSESFAVLLHDERLADRWRDHLLACKRVLAVKADKLDRRSPDHREAKDKLEHVRGLIIELATVKSLLGFADEDFQDVVDGEVRRVGGRYLKGLLSDPALIERWRLALVQMKKNVESQIGARSDDVKALFIEIDNPERCDGEERLSPAELREVRTERHRAANADFVKWRAGAKRFKLGVEERLLEIRRIRVANGDFKANDHALALYMIQTLVDGIESHRAQMLADYQDDEISDVDKELWKLIPLKV